MLRLDNAIETYPCRRSKAVNDFRFDFFDRSKQAITNFVGANLTYARNQTAECLLAGWQPQIKLKCSIKLPFIIGFVGLI